MSALAEKYYVWYMKNMVTKETMRKLVAAGKLTQGEFDKIVADRLEMYGY